MTPSVYILGSAGSGKSTFMHQLLEEVSVGMGPLTDLHARRNAKALVSLRGHQVHLPDHWEHNAPGIYLGKMRDEHPGTDGLDRASHQTGIEWLERGMHDKYQFVLAEGFVLATKGFLAALSEHTDLLVIWLWVDDQERERRFQERGTNQSENFVKSTCTAAFNRATEMRDAGAQVLKVDSQDEIAWDMALDIAGLHLFRK